MTVRVYHLYGPAWKKRSERLVLVEVKLMATPLTFWHCVRRQMIRVSGRRPVMREAGKICCWMPSSDDASRGLSPEEGRCCCLPPPTSG